MVPGLKDWIGDFETGNVGGILTGSSKMALKLGFNTVGLIVSPIPGASGAIGYAADQVISGLGLVGNGINTFIG